MEIVGDKLEVVGIKDMKREILDRIEALGGNISSVAGKSLAEDLCSITFETVLYRKNVDTPWAAADDEEPIEGLGDFIDKNIELYKGNKEVFFNKLYEKYFILTEEPYGQYFWHGEIFTPFKKDSEDFDEWNDMFQKEIYTFKEIFSVVTDKDTDFVHLFYGYGYPDGIYVATKDKNPDNPTVFGTDHEAFFIEIYADEGNLETYLQTFWTKEELRASIEEFIQKKVFC